mmetsp:Transcript_6883/g.20939  ORF Transcript_6883/g.20939 Transcript_6883/m.20939 type:complete len:240 (-) Transcript_6883:591-1310(-)
MSIECDSMSADRLPNTSLNGHVVLQSVSNRRSHVWVAHAIIDIPLLSGSRQGKTDVNGVSSVSNIQSKNEGRIVFEDVNPGFGTATARHFVDFILENSLPGVVQVLPTCASTRTDHAFDLKSKLCQQTFHTVSMFCSIGSQHQICRPPVTLGLVVRFCQALFAVGNHLLCLVLHNSGCEALDLIVELRNLCFYAFQSRCVLLTPNLDARRSSSREQSVAADRYHQRSHYCSSNGPSHPG